MMDVKKLFLNHCTSISLSASRIAEIAQFCLASRYFGNYFILHIHCLLHKYVEIPLVCISLIDSTVLPLNLSEKKIGFDTTLQQNRW